MCMVSGRDCNAHLFFLGMRDVFSYRLLTIMMKSFTSQQAFVLK